MTLDDIERRNSHNDSVISLNSVVFGADYVKMVEDTPILLPRKCSPKNLVISNTSLMAILAGDNPSESAKARDSPLGSKNLTNNQP